MDWFHSLWPFQILFPVPRLFLSLFEWLAPSQTLNLSSKVSSLGDHSWSPVKSKLSSVSLCVGTLFVSFMVLIIACRYFVGLNIECSKETETKSLLSAQHLAQCLAWSSGGFLNIYVNNKAQSYDLFHHRAHQASQFIHFIIQFLFYLLSIWYIYNPVLWF